MVRRHWRCQLPCESLCGTDVDDLFAYSSTKRVAIRDHRLGVLYYIALLGAVVYIGVYTLAYQLAYLEFKIPTGTIRLKLQQPTVNSCDPEVNSCGDAFPDTAQLSYCCQDSCTPIPEDPGACSCAARGGFKNYRCEFLDGDTASQIGRGSIFIATKNKVETETENSNCTKAGSQVCPKLWHIDSVFSYFVAGIENFTLLIDHSAQVPSANFYHQARDVQGYLKVPKGGPAQDRLCGRLLSYTGPYVGEVTTVAPCYATPMQPNDNSSLDIVTVQDLLDAAGIGILGLDEASFAGSHHSVRYEGMTMQMNIRYFNTRAWRGTLGAPGYYYELTAMTKNAYGQHSVDWPTGSLQRTVNAYHGIMLQATVTGQIGTFSFNNLLIQLAASTALLGVAVLLVDTAAMYCCRNRRYYSAAMVERTADFSQVDRLEEASDARLRELCERRHLPTTGGRHAMVGRLLSDDFEETPAGSFQSTQEGMMTPAGRDLEVPLSRR